jgi:hypothetical protein
LNWKKREIEKAVARFYTLPTRKFLYVANTDGVVRFPYRNGDLKVRGPAEKLQARHCFLARRKKDVRLDRLALE